VAQSNPNLQEVTFGTPMGYDIVTNILHDQLINYLWDFYTAKVQNSDWNRCGQIKLQRKGVIYSHNVNHDIADTVNHLQAWKSLNLSKDQKLYRLKFSYNVKVL
jgi:hypothetical protein